MVEKKIGLSGSGSMVSEGFLTEEGKLRWKRFYFVKWLAYSKERKSEKVVDSGRGESIKILIEIDQMRQKIE